MFSGCASPNGSRDRTSVLQVNSVGLIAFYLTSHLCQEQHQSLNRVPASAGVMAGISSLSGGVIPYGM